MVASVQKYGGFYMGRYEASKNTTTNKAQSIPNQMPWVNIPWASAGMSNFSAGGAVEKARNVYPITSSTKVGDVVSTLPYGVQWDATVRFILTKYPEDIITDSKDYGNYGTSNLISTGSKSAYELNNIYDMAGNVLEWTMEREASSGGWTTVYRGGNIYTSGNMNSISSRGKNTYYNTYSAGGFRIALYIK